MVNVLASPKRMMPIIDPEKRARIFRRMHEIRGTIIDRYHKDVSTFDLAKAIADGDRTTILKILRNNPFIKKEIQDETGRMRKPVLHTLRLLLELYNESIYHIKENEPRWDVYRKKKEEIIAYLKTNANELTHTSEIIINALNVLKDAMSGKTRTKAYASEFAWIGETVEKEQHPGKIVLALSGGAAKGVFYKGFLRALQEEGLWPDIVVGTSAGALAGAALATGAGYTRIENTLSTKKLRSLFNPLLAPLTLIISKFGGVIGLGFGKHLRKVLGDRKFSDIADLFIIATVQQPVKFGKTVIGRLSELNGELVLSSDLAVWRAAWGSAAMQGIIPGPVLGQFTAERLSSGEFDIERHSILLPYATLDDGGVVENLPLVTAELLLQEIKQDGLIIAVNLANLYPPNQYKASRYMKLKQHIDEEMKNLGEQAKWHNKCFAYARGFGHWFRQRARRLLHGVAPMRAFNAYETSSYESVIQTVDLVKGKGLKLLINPNAYGSLDEIDLLSFSGAEEIGELGYKKGKELARILLGE